MKHICVYTTPEVLEEKREPDRWCYWEFSNRPKLFKEWWSVDSDGRELRLYFAIKGFIVGYFIIDELRGYNEDRPEFDSDSWIDIKPIPQKPFQGFKYLEIEEVDNASV